MFTDFLGVQTTAFAPLSLFNPFGAISSVFSSTAPLYNSFWRFSSVGIPGTLSHQTSSSATHFGPGGQIRQEGSLGSNIPIPAMSGITPPQVVPTAPVLGGFNPVGLLM